MPSFHNWECFRDMADAERGAGDIFETKETTKIVLVLLLERIVRED